MSLRSSRRPFRDRLPFAPKPDPLFRWRGMGVSRLEGLADAVFAFTVTLLVVALEVPRNYQDLLLVFQGFPAFVATFAILMWFWSTHYIFFRRYGMEDAWTRFLNIAVLLFVVFLAYPLKFIFSSFFAAVFGVGDQAARFNSIGELNQLFVVYGGGLAAVWLGYFLLYLHAYRLRDGLRLSAAEVILTRGSLCTTLINITLCLLSIILASFDRFVWQPGAVYALLGPAMALNGWWHGSRAEAAAKPAGPSAA